jgi:hypothetical protein
VIVAEQVEEAVRQVPVELVGERPPLATGSTFGRVERHYHVPKVRPTSGRIHQREGEHVGGAILPAPAPVEPADLGVGHHQERELRLGPPQGRQEAPRAAGQPAGHGGAAGVTAAGLDRHGPVT